MDSNALTISCMKCTSRFTSTAFSDAAQQNIPDKAPLSTHYPDI